MVYEDPTAVYFDVLKSNTKIGEIYFNRAVVDSPDRIYSVYSGAEEEYHGGSVAEAVAPLENAVGEWLEDEP